jgi:hypothetical protein
MHFDNKKPILILRTINFITLSKGITTRESHDYMKYPKNTTEEIETELKRCELKINCNNL